MLNKEYFESYECEVDPLLDDNVKALDFVNFQIAELLDIKQKLELKIIEDLRHNHEGSRTYEVGKHKVTIKTDYIYSLDKEEYQIYKSQIPAEFNPVRESIKYDIDKRIIKKCDDYASNKDMLTLSKFITKKPAKPNVKIGANI
jgi:hypothetical protein